jgi:hypothetical protein
MRLLLLIPNFVLMVISGYNLIGNATWKNEPNFLVFTMLHILVMLLCLVFMVFILRSVFVIKYVEVAEIAEQPQEERYETVHI